jgi:hypothetical protein
MNFSRNEWIDLLAAIVIPVLVLGSMLLIDLNPSGTREVTMQFGGRNHYELYSPLPTSRYEITERGMMLLAEPLYIPVRKLEGYDEIEIELAFQPGDASLLSLGPRMNIFTGAANMRPYFFEPLEERGDLFARELEQGLLYADSLTSISSLLSLKNVATLMYGGASPPFRDETYTSKRSTSRFEPDLRGSHSFYTFVKNEPLRVAFAFQDMNRSLGADAIDLIIRDELGEIVRTERLGDDGNRSENQKWSENTLSVDIPNLEEGVYKIEWQVTSDIFIRSIETSLSSFVIGGALQVGDRVGLDGKELAQSFYSRSDYLLLSTPHANGAQRIQFGNASVDIVSPNEPVLLLGGPEPMQLTTEKGNMRFAGTGYFAFSEDMYFEPFPRELSAFTNAEDIANTTILTSYVRAESDGDSYKNTYTFSLTDIPEEEGFMRFVLSAPLLDELEEKPILESITVRYSRPPLQSVGDILRALINRLPFISL